MSWAPAFSALASVVSRFTSAVISANHVRGPRAARKVFDFYIFGPGFFPIPEKFPACA